MSCNFVNSIVQPDATEVVSMEPSPIATTAASLTATFPPPSPVPASPTPFPTETSAGGDFDPVCVPYAAPEPLDQMEFEVYPTAIADFLNAGATPAQLDDELYEAGVGSVPTVVEIGDLTGDGKTDIAVSIYNPTVAAILPPGKLLVYVCKAERFQLALEADSPEFTGPPNIWLLQDLDADEQADLVVSYASCGAHTCFEEVQVLSWNGDTFVNRLMGLTEDLPNPYIGVRDPDEDGVFDVEVISGGVASVGAGPQRFLERVWALSPDGELWEVVEENLGPSNYRIHVLQDAETAARAGDFESALVLYQQVVSDATLEDWMEPDVEQANLAAFARYKLMAIYLLEGQTDFGLTAFEELRDAYPTDSPQFAYVELAETFLDGFERGTLADACADAEAFAEQNRAGILEPLGTLAFGYTNLEFTPQDVCP
jgi:hypothetical protein